MTNGEKFIWLIMAGISAQLTRSNRSIRCMALALEVVEGGLIQQARPEQLAVKALEFIDWQFNDKPKPEWVRVDERRFGL